MLAKLHTFSLLGIDALPVEVEVDVSPGAPPKTLLVGLPEQAVKESTHRIERAMVNNGFPLRRGIASLLDIPAFSGNFLDMWQTAVDNTKHSSSPPISGRLTHVSISGTSTRSSHAGVV